MLYPKNIYISFHSFTNHFLTHCHCVIYFQGLREQVAGNDEKAVKVNEEKQAMEVSALK